MLRVSYRRSVSVAPRREKEAYKGPVAGPTKFVNKKKDKKLKGDAKEQREKSRLAQWYEKVGKGLRVDHPKPYRTAEQKAEATMMNKLFRRQNMLLRRIRDRTENHQCKLRMLAIEELPPELQASAKEVDVSPLPREYILVMKEPPLEEEEIFGPVMAGIQYRRELTTVDR